MLLSIPYQPRNCLHRPYRNDLIVCWPIYRQRGQWTVGEPLCNVCNSCCRGAQDSTVIVTCWKVCLVDSLGWLWSFFHYLREAEKFVVSTLLRMILIMWPDKRRLLSLMGIGWWRRYSCFRCSLNERTIPGWETSKWPELPDKRNPLLGLSFYVFTRIHLNMKEIIQKINLYCALEVRLPFCSFSPFTLKTNTHTHTQVPMHV